MWLVPPMEDIDGGRPPEFLAMQIKAFQSLFGNLNQMMLLEMKIVEIIT